MFTDPKSPFDGVAIVRFRPFFFVLATVSLAIMVWVWWSGAFLNMWAWLWLPGFALGLSRRPWTKREVPVHIGVRDDHLLVDGASVAPLRAISSAFVGALPGKRRAVRLERRRRPAVELRVRDDAHAAALMRALGLGPTQWAASYALPPQRGDRRAYLVLALLVGIPCVVVSGLLVAGGAQMLFGSSLLANLLAPVCAVSLLVVPTSAFMPRLLVGTDGVSLVLRGHTRFVRYDEIADVRVEERVFTITLTTNQTLLFKGPFSASGPIAYYGPDPEQIAERIREAKAAATSEGDAPQAALLRGFGPPAERIHALRAIGRKAGEGEYRSAQVSTEQLWRSLESSSADPKARAGAAIALRERLDETCRRRLRIVAAATAEPKLRAAIESAAGDDDAPLEEAFAALESDAAEERAVRREGLAEVMITPGPPNSTMKLTNGQVRYAHQSTRSLSSLVGRTQQRSDGGMGPEHPPGFLERPAIASTRET